jgi:low temperature requirement protein LtrA
VVADAPAASEPGGVTTLELFFDLVFVFTLTQLTSVLVHDATWAAVGEVALMLGLIFWMYGGYVWLTNEVALDRISRRLTLLGGMAGLMVVALAIPAAFKGSGATFGFGYLAVVLIHMAMFARSPHVTVVDAIRGLAPFNLSTALIVVLGGILGGTAQYVLWTLAVLVAWVSPKLIDQSGFVIEPRHFVERHGLVIIVAIGESVIAVGAGATGLVVGAGLIDSALFGLALSACLWWSYFGDEERVEEAFVVTAQADRPRVAIDGFGYCHLLLLFGVIVMAAGLKKATGHPFDPLDAQWALALGGGAAVFLTGEALFRRVLALDGAAGRAVAAAAALATVLLGWQAGATAQLAALIAIFVVMLVVAARARRDALVPAR